MKTTGTCTEPFNLIENNCQVGTLDYNRKPEIWVDNGISMHVRQWDAVQAKRIRAERKKRYVS